MDLVFKIVKDPSKSILDIENIDGFCVGRNFDLNGLSDSQRYKRLEDIKAGAALMCGVSVNQLIPSNFMEMSLFRLEGYAAPPVSKGDGYSYTRNNGLKPKATRPGRKAIKKTGKELMSGLISKGLSMGLRREQTTDSRYLERIVSHLVSYDSKIQKDLSKIKFSKENVSANDSNLADNNKSNNLMGIHTLSNGFSFLGCYAGGDWEFPVYFIIYHDGKSLRAYVPNNGNVYNTYSKTAFGSGDEQDVRWIQDSFPGKYVDLEEDDFDLGFLDSNGIDFDWNTLKSEIETRIIVQ